MKTKYVILIFGLLLNSYNLNAQISGCTDPLAKNYDPTATENDGSCIYNSVSISPTSTHEMSPTLSETSGLIFWNNTLWTHNDDSDINLYSLDTLNGEILGKYPITGTKNIDWEDIAQDDNYFYIGDFGNNSNGNRTNLKILRIEKNSLVNNILKIDTINFSYSDQKDFTGTGSNNSDFDCEAFIASGDSIYLFTKQWISKRTSVYCLPKSPGTYSANLKSSYNIDGLITGAVYLEAKKLVVLCGYNNLLQPFIYLLYDFNNKEFFAGNKRKVDISLPFHQTEGIATANGLKYYISNENFVKSPFVNNPQKLHILNLSSLLTGYFERIMDVDDSKTSGDYIIYPQPASDFIELRIDTNSYSRIMIYSASGNLLHSSSPKNIIDISFLTPGIYYLKAGHRNFKFIKI